MVQVTSVESSEYIQVILVHLEGVVHCYIDNERWQKGEFGVRVIYGDRPIYMKVVSLVLYIPTGESIEFEYITPLSPETVAWQDELVWVKGKVNDN